MKANKIDINVFIAKYRTEHKTFNPAYSPALKGKINFNSDGFSHLIFKGGKKRTGKIVMNRLPLLPLTVPVIKNCPKVLEKRVREEKIKGIEGEVKVTYYSLEAIVGKSSTRVRVVIRKVGTNGNLNFFSIMKFN